jgi:hypothetical protein
MTSHSTLCWKGGRGKAGDEDLFIDGNLAKPCSRCNVVKQIAMFSPQKNGVHGACSVCKECNKAKVALYRCSLHGFSQMMVDNARRRAKEHVRSGRELQGTFSIDVIFIVESWARQEGRCILYTLPMAHTSLTAFQVSIERLADDTTYTPTNSVLCCLEAQNRNKMTRAKVLHIVNLQDESLSDAELAAWEAEVRHVPEPTTRQNRVLDEDGNRLCRACDVFLPVEIFGTQASNMCRVCLNAKSVNTWRGRFERLFGNMKAHSQQRKQVYNVALNDLITAFVQQRGVCSYTGVRLTSEGDWCISIERINPAIGYMKNNIVLVAAEFNAIQHRSTTQPSGHGWTREKVVKLRAEFDHSYYSRVPLVPVDYTQSL